MFCLELLKSFGSEYKIEERLLPIRVDDWMMIYKWKARGPPYIPKSRLGGIFQPKCRLGVMEFKGAKVPLQGVLRVGAQVPTQGCSAVRTDDVYSLYLWSLNRIDKTGPVFEKSVTLYLGNHRIPTPTTTSPPPHPCYPHPIGSRTPTVQDFYYLLHHPDSVIPASASLLRNCPMPNPWDYSALQPILIQNKFTPLNFILQCLFLFIFITQCPFHTLFSLLAYAGFLSSSTTCLTLSPCSNKSAPWIVNLPPQSIELKSQQFWSVLPLKHPPQKPFSARLPLCTSMSSAIAYILEILGLKHVASWLHETSKNHAGLNVISVYQVGKLNLSIWEVAPYFHFIFDHTLSTNFCIKNGDFRRQFIMMTFNSFYFPGEIHCRNNNSVVQAYTPNVDCLKLLRCSPNYSQARFPCCAINQIIFVTAWATILVLLDRFIPGLSLKPLCLFTSILNTAMFLGPFSIQMVWLLIFFLHRDSDLFCAVISLGYFSLILYMCYSMYIHRYAFIGPLMLFISIFICCTSGEAHGGGSSLNIEHPHLTCHQVLIDCSWFRVGKSSTLKVNFILEVEVIARQGRKCMVNRQPAQHEIISLYHLVLTVVYKRASPLSLMGKPIQPFVSFTHFRISIISVHQSFPSHISFRERTKNKCNHQIKLKELIQMIPSTNYKEDDKFKKHKKQFLSLTEIKINKVKLLGNVPFTVKEDLFLKAEQNTLKPGKTKFFFIHAYGHSSIVCVIINSLVLLSIFLPPSPTQSHIYFIHIKYILISFYCVQVPQFNTVQVIINLTDSFTRGKFTPLDELIIRFTLTQHEHMLIYLPKNKMNSTTNHSTMNLDSHFDFEELTMELEKKLNEIKTDFFYLFSKAINPGYNNKINVLYNSRSSLFQIYLCDITPQQRGGGLKGFQVKTYPISPFQFELNQVNLKSRNLTQDYGGREPQRLMMIVHSWRFPRRNILVCFAISLLFEFLEPTNIESSTCSKQEYCQGLEPKTLLHAECEKQLQVPMEGIQRKLRRYGSNWLPCSEIIYKSSPEEARELNNNLCKKRQDCIEKAITLFSTSTMEEHRKVSFGHSKGERAQTLND
ncbi:hypothetical protein VP01_1228g1 [Puccinia sorghi]|uniref:Uncharacterized protein n=1 Tax=Puccinia sorghi TaxID=27349 RepID=A0A0L6VPT8_9BASI|nr:hypothetical protein VP01_1228g1 [Puccinia sorghi]